MMEQKTKTRLIVYSRDAQVLHKTRAVVANDPDLELALNPREVKNFDLCLVDPESYGDDSLLPVLESLNAAGAFVMLLCRRAADAKKLVQQGLLADILRVPLQSVELGLRLQQLKLLIQAARLLDSEKAALGSMTQAMGADLQIASELQKKFYEPKFEAVPGFRFTHKYLSGLRSGADYFDAYPFEDGTHMGLLMTDSSGYGLSSLFLNSILRAGTRMQVSEINQPALQLQRLYRNLKFAMKAGEGLSVALCVINKKNLNMTVASRGHVRCFLNATQLTLDSSPMRREDDGGEWKEVTVQLQPGDRVSLLTDGFYELFQRTELEMILKSVDGMAPLEAINECVYRVKSRFETDEDMPEQDGSVLLLDIERNAMRLVR